MAGGRPLKFKTPEELQEKIDAYFATTGRQVDKDGNEYFEPITITGLALALDTSRKVLVEYEEKDEFSNAIKRAKLRCENFAEKMLYSGKSPAGSIFALKNFNWTDKTITEHAGTINVVEGLYNAVAGKTEDIPS